MIKKIIYITNSRLPTEKARGYQIASMCHEFARAGLLVDLVVPLFKNDIKEDIFSYYGLSKNFGFKRLFVIDLKFLNKIWPKFTYAVKQISFILTLACVFLFRSRQETVIYTREALITWALKKLNYQVVFEAHFIPDRLNQAFFKAARLADKIVANSKGTAQEFLNRNFKNVLICPNGVNLEDFKGDVSKTAIRTKLGLPADKKIITYLGHFHQWKGTEIILDIAARFRERKDIIFNLIGGTGQDIEKLQKAVKQEKLDNIKILGWKKITAVPAYLQSSDLLLLTLNPNSQEARLYTSPLKLFEYLASRVTVLAPDLPSLKNIVSASEVIFYRAGDAWDLIGKINENLGKDNQDLINNAYQLVKEFSWPKRVQKILSFISDVEREKRKKITFSASEPRS